MGHVCSGINGNAEEDGVRQVAADALGGKGADAGAGLIKARGASILAVPDRRCRCWGAHGLSIAVARPPTT